MTDDKLKNQIKRASPVSEADKDFLQKPLFGSLQAGVPASEMDEVREVLEK